MTAAKAVHQATTREGSLTVVLSPSARQSGEFLRKAEGFTRRLGLRPKGDGRNEISLEYPNGGRIVGLPGKEATVRGFSAVGLLLIDEAARVSEELYEAARPMMAVGDGDLWLMSTPNGKRGFFWEAWANGGAEWTKVKAPATECARISKKFLDEERQRMADRVFRREYLCEFGESEDSVFRYEDIERAMDWTIEPLKIPR